MLKENTVCLTSDFTLIGKSVFSLSDCLNADLSGIPFRPDRITVTYAGAKSFSVPSGVETEKVLDSFEGVIAYHHPLNEFHPDAFQFLKKPPVCVSYDGIDAVGTPGGECRLCPHRASGGCGDGRCKSKRRLFLMLGNMVFPYEMIVPANSMRNYTRYMRYLLSRGLTPSQVVTRFSAERCTNGVNGKLYSQMQFEFVRELNADERLFIQDTTSCLEDLVDRDWQARQGRMNVSKGCDRNGLD